MLKKLQRQVNNRKYFLVHNGEKLNITIRRIKGLKEYIKYVAKMTEAKEGKGFFIFNEYNFASFGMSEVLDIVFVDWDGKVFHIEESFNMNKISEKFDNTKYIYVLPKNTINKNKILTNDTLTHEYDRKKGAIKMTDFL